MPYSDGEGKFGEDSAGWATQAGDFQRCDDQGLTDYR
jgi:hypothetical protein